MYIMHREEIKAMCKGHTYAADPIFMKKQNKCYF